MSERDLTFFGSYYASRLGGSAAGAVIPVEDGRRKDRPTEGVQTNGYGATTDLGTSWGGAWLCGYGPRAASTPETYLSLLLDPVLAAARMYALNPIRIGKAKLVKKREDAPDEWAKPLEEMTRPRLTPYAEDAVWGVDMGWSGFQNVWERREGLWWLLDVIACRQEADSGILADRRTGNKLGVRWNGVDLYGHKAFSYTHDRRGQQWLGRSRLENVLDAIQQWRELNDMTAKMGRKASGVVIGVGYPPGKDNAAAAANKEKAEAWGKGITTGACYFTYPTLGGLTDEKIRGMAPADLVKFLELTLWPTRHIDLGDPGASIGATTEEKRYIDELKCLGYGVPPQAILHGMFGARADSASKGNSGTAMNEAVNRGIHDAFNKGPLNSILELNWGPDARDAYAWEPEPLEDQQSVFDREILKMVAQSDAGMAYLSRLYDLDSIAERNGLPKRAQPLAPGEGIQPAVAQKPGENGREPGAPPNGAKPVNGFRGRLEGLLTRLENGQ